MNSKLTSLPMVVLAALLLPGCSEEAKEPASMTVVKPPPELPVAEPANPEPAAMAPHPARPEPAGTQAAREPDSTLFLQTPEPQEPGMVRGEVPTLDRISPARPPVEPTDPEQNPVATAKLNRAKRLEKEGKARLANKLYREIIEQFPGTETVLEAGELLEAGVAGREGQAQRLLDRAQSLEQLGSKPEAMADYQNVARLYSETPQAKTASERLKAYKQKQQTSKAKN